MKRKIELTWQGYYEYTSDNVQKYAPTNAGVYKIGIKQKDGKLAVRYIGQANDLDRRLKEHLDLKNEQNECLAERLKKYHAEFSFAEVSSQGDRDGAEKALYDFYTPDCNDPDGIPNGPDIEINPR
ncbi:GIY-YIG nuclease family protein [Candidatus Nomurabacteria bacterium]|nr:GIY-YIG nuclease family protein [Candidatus Nomurabacteria bacterium]